jgi:hypothetical protein
LISGLKKKKKKMKKAFLIALMTKAAILTKAVLLGAVILAKKALIVSILSLFLSAMTASKKTAAPNGNKGDHKYRRFGTINYLDLNPDNPKQDIKYIDPMSGTKQWLTSQEHHTEYYPKFIHKHEDIYNGDTAENGSFQSQAHAPSRYANRHNTYDANGDWLGLTHPDHIQ